MSSFNPMSAIGRCEPAGAESCLLSSLVCAQIPSGKSQLTGRLAESN